MRCDYESAVVLRDREGRDQLITEIIDEITTVKINTCSFDKKGLDGIVSG